jgi:hypothetical protein
MNALLKVLFVLLAFSYSSAQNIHRGDTVSFGGGYAFTWVEVDPGNIPLRVGLTFSEESVTSPAPGTISLDFPEVSVDSFFKHMYFDYAPNGHPPQNIYGSPHIDFHFYMIPASERLTITGGFDIIPVSGEFIPEDYILTPGVSNYSFPAMGVHYTDSLAEELNGMPFQKTLIYGFYEGEMIFVEPMITRQYLLTHPNEVLPIKQPQAYQRKAYYPTNYSVSFNNTNNEFELSLTDLILRNGTTSADENNGLSPDNYQLFQNYPNPFNPRTTIKYNIPIVTLRLAQSDATVTLKVYDLLGREVAVLVDEFKPAGSYEVEFDATHFSSGTYFYRLTSGDFAEAKKLIILK